MAPKILFILTSTGKIPSTGKQTGWYLPEVAHPWHELHTKAEITFASPAGGEAPLDPASVEAFKADPISASFLENQKSLWENTVPLSSLVPRASEFDAVFFPGGHGPMFDVVNDKDSIRITEAVYAAGKPVAAVCHGPAGLLNVTAPDGNSILEGRTVVGFSDSEEEAAGFVPEMPFSLEKELGKKSGGGYVKAEKDWGEKVVVDGRVITGQNPASSKGVAEAIAKALGEF
ncbi:related to NonF protein, involved in nonactin biosynthesis [Cephalotrichum gorgonifer]|uniref:D-lactate dehydratase n=1 Tax=Cephalotrichum gorgonifer TaxID=2041049 RepID=A0AAE8N740_9PEZI|nr:related to NonF protein, involved in nonactin biosynthesis [Cephalotrichum gorgonifer]